ncbi:serralysin [Nitrosarchaeum sp.]|nr:serralysin [Nitrosarchaeum sp.]
MKKTKTIEKNAKIVNKYLISKIKGNPKILYDAASHLIIHGGKRLRPYMVIKSCQILGGNMTIAMPAASAVEMIHNFTLVHDDIMDNDEIRHGVSTVHKKFGMPIAILAGDVLFSKAYQTISNAKLSNDAKIQLVSRLAKACVDVCEGQLLDVKMAEEKRIPTQKEYITMIGKKTSALFDVSCSMGAICATCNKKDISNLSDFGRNLGIAFQITDDLIGVMGDSKITKKPVGNDLKEGKKSLPILMAIKLAKGKDKEIILKVFGNSETSKNELEKAVNVIRSLGIEKEVRMQALHYAERAEKSLLKYSGSAKTELINLLDFVVKRSV